MRRYSKAFNLLTSLLLILPLLTAGAEEAEKTPSWRQRLDAAISAENYGVADVAHWLELLSDADIGVNYYSIANMPKNIARDAKVFDRLMEIALKSRVAPLRVAASEKLAVADSIAFAAECQKRFVAESNPAEVQKALDAIGYLDTDESVKLLGEVIRKSQNMQISQHAFKVLLRLPSRPGLQLLIAIANDSDAAPALRTQAIGSMRVFPFFETIEALIALLQDQDIEIADAAWVALMAVTDLRLEPEPVEWERWWEKEKMNFKFPPQVSIPRIEPLKIAADELQEAIDLGIEWLIAHQDEDGRFDSLNYSKHDPNGESGYGKNTTDVCMTALAALTMMSVGIKGNDELAKIRAAAVAKAMGWLIKWPSEPGNYRSDNNTTYVHEQGLATWALAEYVAAGHRDYEKPMLEAFDKCMEFRDEDRAWGYPKMVGNSTNSCVTYWYGCAFAAARRAGFDLPRKGFEGIAWWFDNATEEYSGLIYNASAKEPSPAMTGAGLLQKSFLFWDMDGVVQKRSASIILNRQIELSSYYDLYMYSLGLSRLRIPEAAAFVSHIHRRLIYLQDAGDTPRKGSWNPNGDIWETSRLYTAAMAVTALSVYTSQLACLVPPLE